MGLSLNKEFLFILAESSLTSEYHYIPTSDPTASLKVIRKRELGHKYSVEAQGQRFLIRSNGAKRFLNYRLFSCLRDAPDKWDEVCPYDPLVELSDVTPFQSHIVLTERKDGMVKLRILDAHDGVLDGSNASHDLVIDETLYAVDTAPYSQLNYDSTVLRFSYSTPVANTKVVEYDMAKRTSTVLKEQPVPGNFVPSEYTMEKIYAPIPPEHQTVAPFNTPCPDKIPMSVLYKTSLFKGDGSNPLYLYGYGSYGISIDATFSASRISLVDRGFVFVIAHIRGGGDNGKAWYETGKFKHKKNTFLDFNICAKHLIEKKYTSSRVLCIEGRSAGGLLIGASLNMEPELYAVAVAGVPFVDVINTMMDDKIPLTINEYEEWGNPNAKDYFDYMLSYSPYDNIPADRQFPDLLIKAGLFDPRVAYWEPAKWLAKLRAMGVDKARHESKKDSLLVLDCKMGSGHFGSSGRYAYLKEIAADYAFVVSRIQQKTGEMNGNIPSIHWTEENKHPESRPLQPHTFVPMNAASLLAAEDSFLNSPTLSRKSSGYFSPYEDDYGAGEMNSLSLDSAVEPNANNEYVCGECNRTFNKLVALRSHEVVHSNDKKHLCQFCQKPFARRHDMLRHQRTVHATEQALTCEVCKITFPDAENLQQHCLAENHPLPEKPASKMAPKSRSKLAKKGAPSGSASSVKRPASTAPYATPMVSSSMQPVVMNQPLGMGHGGMMLNPVLHAQASQQMMMQQTQSSLQPQGIYNPQQTATTFTQPNPAGGVWNQGNFTDTMVRPETNSASTYAMSQSIGGAYVSAQMPSSLFSGFPLQNPQQTFTMPFQDPSYMRFNPQQAQMMNQMQSQRQMGGQPHPAYNMNQMGYQMNINAPHQQPDPQHQRLKAQQSLPPQLQIQPPVQASAVQLSNNFAFEPSLSDAFTSPSAARFGMFEDKYESVVDGLVIQEDAHLENYMPLPSKLLMDFDP
ncbi:hypothetical protein HDU91_004660 [Kappamyces sp. JEL0680]|nr:hypothetical protein HDU91_004660 [Kappamyces sp. JEL0680]